MDKRMKEFALKDVEERIGIVATIMASQVWERIDYEWQLLELNALRRMRDELLSNFVTFRTYHEIFNR